MTSQYTPWFKTHDDITENMSKKRGLSVDEKRSKMLEVFYEKKEVFQLKELEKICPKEKGITPMSVKEILQSLVDDDLVCGHCVLAIF